MDKIKFLMDNLKIDLAVKHNNYNCGSTKGGDIVKYFWLITQNISFEPELFLNHKDDLFQVVLKGEQFLGVNCSYPNILDSKFSLKDFREKFDSFFDANIAKHFELNTESIHLTDLSWLAGKKDLFLNRANYDFLFESIMLTNKVKDKLPFLEKESPPNEEMMSLLNSYSKFPEFISVLPIRELIGIENIIAYHLDEGFQIGTVYNKIKV